MGTLNKSELPTIGRRLNKSALPSVPSPVGESLDLEAMLDERLARRLPELVEDFASKALEEMTEQDIEAELADLEKEMGLGELLDGDDTEKGAETDDDEDTDEEPDDVEEGSEKSLRLLFMRD